MSNARDNLRGSIFATKPKVTEVTMDDEVSTIVEVRQPLVGQMLDLTLVEDPKIRMARMLVSCCFVKETNEALFENTDVDNLMLLPSGEGPYQKLMDAVQKNMGIGTQLEEAAKK